MVKDTTLYDRLEVSPDADESKIQKAYFKLSKKYHPDKHVNASEQDKQLATQKFQEINQSKEILLDKEKRNMYDQVGMDMFSPEMQGGQQMHNPFEHFGNMFGHGFPFGFNVNMSSNVNVGQRNKPPENITKTINVTLEQIYNEETIDFTYNHKHYCQKCNGEGTKDGKTSICGSCNGKGMKVQVIQMGPMIQQTVGTCNICSGKGTIIKEENKCVDCLGNGNVNRDKTIQVKLKSGLAHDNQINLAGKGHNLKNGKTDLILVINEITHDKFKRNDNDLFIIIDLKLYQALFGFDKIITHLDGRKLHISHTGNTDFNAIRKIVGEGIKSLNSDKKGDLYIKFNISLPNLSLLQNETKNQIKSIVQSFDKNEVQNEAQILKMTNLNKTIINDCKNEQNNLKQLFDKLNNVNRSYANNKETFDNEQNEGPQQCVHQ